MTNNVIDQIRRRHAAWRAAGRSREGFFRLVCRGFDDVLGACGGACVDKAPLAAGEIVQLDGDFSVKRGRVTAPDFDAFKESILKTGILASGSPLEGRDDDDDVWAYTLSLIAEKVVAWLAQSWPGRPELLLTLAAVKERLHKTEEASDLNEEARKAWSKGSRRMRAASGRKSLGATAV